MLIGRLTLGTAMMSACMASMPASAQGSLPDQLAVCARIGKKDARLECYDSIARASAQSNHSSSFGSSSIPTPQQAPPPPPMPAAPAAGASFGAEQIARPVAERAKDVGNSEIAITVASARDNGIGMWTITLTDGAIWRMTESVGNFRPPKPQETVTISKGALGSYLMQVDRQAAVRVQRVR